MATDTQLGRLGLDVEWGAPKRVGRSADGTGQIYRVSGAFRGATLAQTLALGGEFIAQAEIQEPLPFISATLADLNGFVVINDLDVDEDWRNAARQGKGWIEFDMTLDRKGSYSQTKLMSILAMVSAVEDHATTPSYSWAPPIGALAVDAGTTAPTLITRATAAGDIVVATDMTVGTWPTWSVDPASYFDGAVEVWAGDRLRAGLDMPMDPTDWYISNDIMQIRPSVYQGSSDGGLQVRFHDGTAWGDWTDFDIYWAGTNVVPAVGLCNNPSGRRRNRPGRPVARRQRIPHLDHCDSRAHDQATQGDAVRRMRLQLHRRCRYSFCGGRRDRHCDPSGRHSLICPARYVGVR